MGIALTEVQASSMDEELMRKAIGYIEEQIANPELSVERLSREMGMSRVNFYKKCLSITGKTPVEVDPYGALEACGAVIGEEPDAGQRGRAGVRFQ